MGKNDEWSATMPVAVKMTSDKGGYIVLFISLFLNRDIIFLFCGFVLPYILFLREHKVKHLTKTKLHNKRP